MPESTLQRLARDFPNVKLQQTYGLIELGALRSKSKSNDSLWVRVGGEGYKTRVVDGMLQIKAKSAAMLGYMNAPSPFTGDGWFMTGDAVEVDGDYIRLLGRKSELINVGGEKVYPAEIENVIQEIDNVAEVTVRGKPNPILGNIVHATVTLQTPEDKKVFARRLKKYCRARLQSYQVPVKVEVVDEKQHSERFKKSRAKQG
jgi:acyl-CoA synthetase (AMP-forming)/AMP-acid ligase II